MLSPDPGGPVRRLLPPGVPSDDGGVRREEADAPALAMNEMGR